jgi:hypothetical protein
MQGSDPGVGPFADLLGVRPGIARRVRFALAALGAGWYVVAVLAAELARSPGVTVASWAAAALVLAACAPVAADVARLWTGPRALARLWRSWTARELLIGIGFVLLVAADLAFPLRLHRAQAGAAALLLILIHGVILRRSRGVPADRPVGAARAAWLPEIPVRFLASALASGTGAYLVVESAAGRTSGVAAWGVVLLALALTACIVRDPLRASARSAGPAAGAADPRS